MALNEIHLGDTGTLIRRQVVDESGLVVDLTEATLLKFHFTKPDRTVFSVDPALGADANEGWCQYYTTAEDLDQTGKWFLQVEVAVPGGAWHSETLPFTVVGNLA